MKSNYVKVSLALLSAVFILACQDVGTGPDGLVPEFHHGRGSHAGGDGEGGSNVAFKLDLTFGMLTTGLDMIGKDSNVIQNNDFVHGITWDFGAYTIDDCKVIRGTGGATNVTEIEESHANTLLAELRGTTGSGSFGMSIDLTGLEIGDTATGPHFVGVWYDNPFGKRSRIVLENRDGATVRWVSNSASEAEDVFEFTGPVTVGIQGVAGKGRKGNRTIACGEAGDNKVVATVTRVAA